MTATETANFLDIPEIVRLKAVLDKIAPEHEICVAYSGGLDSRFLTFAAQKLGFKVDLLHIIGPQIAPDETAGALKDAAALGLDPLLIPAASLTLPELAEAGVNRCYVCKTHLFTELIDIARKSGCRGPVCDGTNASDLGVFRPGVKALQELHVASPLADAGITKARIREIGRAVGFPKPDQAARPCLLTRFPYGATPERSQLEAIADAELFVAQDPVGEKLRFRIRMPKTGDTRLHVSRASLDTVANGPAELERIAEKLRCRFGEKLPNLQVEVLDKLSGYYDHLQQPEGTEAV